MVDQLTNISKTDLIRLLIDNTPVAFMILDENYRIHYVNENFLKLRKLRLEDILGDTCYNVSNKGIKCNNCAVRDALETKKRTFISRKDVLDDGTVRYIDDYAIPIEKVSEDDVQYVLEIMVNRTQEMVSRDKKYADYEEIVAILSSLLEAKDNYTAAHSLNVRTVAIKLANAIGLGDAYISDIALAASLHDIGKVLISDKIINKPGILTDEEYSEIKQHPKLSYDIISDISTFGSIKEMVHQHHEKYDGKGYPDGLAADEINLGARIITIADSFEAMTSTRSYRHAQSKAYALEEIKRCSGTQFDPDIVEIFLNLDFNEDSEVEQLTDTYSATVERVLPTGDNLAQAKPKSNNADTFACVDENKLLESIFDNTPCGFSILDADLKVIYVSKYFLDYLGIFHEVVGKHCFDASGFTHRDCSRCPVIDSIKSGSVEYSRKEVNTKSGQKIFDVFGVPMKDSNGKVEYVVQTVIDRTQEVLFEKQRAQDIKKLIGKFEELLEMHSDEGDSSHMPKEIINLNKRLSMLIGENEDIDKV